MTDEFLSLAKPAMSDEPRIEPRFMTMLRCPVSGMRLQEMNGFLVSADGQYRYKIDDSGIPLFAEQFCSEDARRQERHYDKIAEAYLANLGYPHTQEYMRYLDEAFLAATGQNDLGAAAEICCGGGEAFQLLGDRVRRGVGVDISLSMLHAARRKHAGGNYVFLQGDATRLPLLDNQFDSAFVLGGIHHVNARQKLFSEIFRILKPGGRFYFREPVSDFALWRWLRAAVYRLSPTLDAETERPLLYCETVPPLRGAGFEVKHWRTYGFLGYCLLMNSDVLVVNRLFRFIPGIRALTRFAVTLDDWTLRTPGLAGAGLIVVGVAEKPKEARA